MHLVDNLTVLYHTEVCIKSLSSCKYLGFSQSSQAILAEFPSGSTQISSPQKRDSYDCAVNFKLLPKENDQGKEVMEGSRVYLVSSSEEYLICTTKGEIKFDKKSSNQEINKVLLKSAVWSVQCKQNVRSLLASGLRPLTYYDEVCFKSELGTYISIRKDNSCQTVTEVMGLDKAFWQIWPSDVPEIPQWVLKKTHSRANKSDIPRDRRLLKTCSPQVQEALLVEDLLDILLGFEGTYVRRRVNQSFAIEPHLEQPSCNIANSQLVGKILLLQSHYQIIDAYISKHSLQQGTICQALCGGLRVLVKEYKMMVVQLDEQAAKEELTLQMMWYYIQKILKVMESLVMLVKEAEHLKGGQLISCVIRLINGNTDEHVVEIFNYLFRSAITLYVQMVSRWIYEGEVEDRYGQFMVISDQFSGKWQDWEDRYHLRHDQIPSLFEKQAKTILVTGKYLNILKVCKKTINNPFSKNIETSQDIFIKAQDFNQPLQQAYQWANQQLKTLILHQCKLQEVMRSMKGYYFLEYGDLFVHFMDAAEEELSLPKAKGEGKDKHFCLEKIENLFELLIRTSSANGDPYKEDISCKIENISLFEQVHRIKTLQGSQFQMETNERPFVKKDSRYVDFLSLEFRCSFPLSLIISKRNIAKYQVIFRYLFLCKFVERQLNSTWLTLQATKEIGLRYYHQASMLNQRMVNYIKNYVYYLCYEVLEQNYIAFSQKINKAANFEEIMVAHNAFLNGCLKESLLTNGRVLPIFTADLGGTCQGYFQIKQYLMQIHEQKYKLYQIGPEKGSLVKRKARLQELQAMIRETLGEQEFLNFVGTYSSRFQEAMRGLLKEIYSMLSRQENSHYLVRLLERIDEEKYYQRKIVRQ